MTKKEAMIIMSKSEDEVSIEDFNEAVVTIANASIDGYILVNGAGLRTVLNDSHNTVYAERLFNELTN